MKKILFVILLSIIICSFPIEKNEELENVLKGIDISIIEKIWNIIKTYIDKAIKFLKEIGLYDPIIKIIQKYGREYGIIYCTSFSIPEGICKDIIDFLLKLI